MSDGAATDDLICAFRDGEEAGRYESQVMRKRSIALPVVFVSALWLMPIITTGAVSPQTGPAVPQQGTTATPLPHVYVLATGGTIAGRGASTTSGSNYERGAVAGEELIARVPEIQQHARISVEQISNLYGSDLTLAHWLTLAKRINTIFQDDPTVAGIVVTHGTNTLEETAYFLHLTVKDPRPVVVI